MIKMVEHNYVSIQHRGHLASGHSSIVVTSLEEALLPMCEGLDEGG